MNPEPENPPTATPPSETPGNEILPTPTMVPQPLPGTLSFTQTPSSASIEVGIPTPTILEEKPIWPATEPTSPTETPTPTTTSTFTASTPEQPFTPSPTATPTPETAFPTPSSTPVTSTYTEALPTPVSQVPVEAGMPSIADLSTPGGGTTPANAPLTTTSTYGMTSVTPAEVPTPEASKPGRLRGLFKKIGI